MSTILSRLIVLNDRKKFCWPKDRADIDRAVRALCALLNGLSELDGGTLLNYSASRNGRLVFQTSYKHAVGRSFHTVVVVPWKGKSTVTTFGRNRDNANEAISASFRLLLLEEV